MNQLYFLEVIKGGQEPFVVVKIFKGGQGWSMAVKVVFVFLHPSFWHSAKYINLPFFMPFTTSRSQ